MKLLAILLAVLVVAACSSNPTAPSKEKSILGFDSATACNNPDSTTYPGVVVCAPPPKKRP